MAFVREKVPQEDWKFFNDLNIQYLREQITADKYSTWVIDRDNDIIFTNICLGGRDYGHTYILKWKKLRIYIYMESRSEYHSEENARKYHWDIKRITAPKSLEGKRDELVNLIRNVAVINYDPRSSSIFVIDNIAEPRFIEEV
ncbi:hypothetical protein DSECCO2_445400 [anaerobic digester metagenome]